MIADASRPLRDVLAFSGALPAGVAAALSAAAGRALVPEAAPELLGPVAALAAAGTLVVYNVDRLRDLERDRETAPARTRFVQTHRGAVLAVTVCAAAACVPLALRMTPGVWAMCAAVLMLGLWHRRLKGRAAWKIVYVSIAWLGVVVGLPVTAAGGASPRPLLVATAALGTTIAANLMASDLREQELTPTRLQSLTVARGLALTGVLLCGLDSRVWPLAAVPGLEALCLLGFRNTESYGLIVLDGALLVGAGASLAFMAWGR